MVAAVAGVAVAVAPPVRKALKRKVKLKLSGSFTDLSGHKTSAKARKVTIKRR